jgi:hypothetical protein
MGSGSWKPSDWDTYATTSGMSSKSTREIYSSKLNEDLDPKKITFRESRDSADNANSTAIIIGLDVTGSMGRVLDSMARKGLPTLMKDIYDRKPVTSPQVCCLAIGDAECDSAPLQATQFESDIRIATDLEKLYLEMGGGGNEYEGYALAWYFAALHTKIDCFEKRGKKGYLFTVGDEEPTPHLLKKNLKDIFGHEIQSDFSMDALLTMASKQWEIFHLIVDEGSNGKFPSVDEKWKKVLGQRALHLADHTKMAEVIVSTIQVAEGTDHAAVVDSWDKSTALVVSKAIGGLTVGTNSSVNGVVSL